MLRRAFHRLFRHIEDDCPNPLVQQGFSSWRMADRDPAIQKLLIDLVGRGFPDAKLVASLLKRRIVAEVRQGQEQLILDGQGDGLFATLFHGVGLPFRLNAGDDLIP
jgi:hypothetical protein